MASILVNMNVKLQALEAQQMHRKKNDVITFFKYQHNTHVVHNATVHYCIHVCMPASVHVCMRYIATVARK